jgi:thiol-disulfide isomerase/thioredoxin
VQRMSYWCSACLIRAVHVLLVQRMSYAPQVLLVHLMSNWCTACLIGAPHVLLVHRMTYWCTACLIGAPHVLFGAAHVLLVQRMSYWCTACLIGAPHVLLDPSVSLDCLPGKLIPRSRCAVSIAQSANSGDPHRGSVRRQKKEREQLPDSSPGTAP